MPANEGGGAVEVAPCPKCGTRLSVSPGDLGADVECPYCQTVFKARRPGEAASPPPPPKPKSGGLDFADAGPPKPRFSREDDPPPKKRRDDDDDDEDDRPRRRRRSGRATTRTLMRIGVLSFAKHTAVLAALIGLLYGGIYGLFLLVVGIGAGGAGGRGGAAAGGMMAAGGLCVVVFMPVFFAIGGFIGGAIEAWLFNLATSWVGGIEMEFEDD